MRIEQLQLFEFKGSFDPDNFESIENNEIFKSIGRSISNAFLEFSNFPVSTITKLDFTTRSNILNNLVVDQIKENCQSDRFRYYSNLTNTRRSFAILDEKYILFFKKSPVSNVKTNQDDIIKNQELGKHVLFVAYHLDEFWSSITKLEFQYFSSPNNITYTYDISEFISYEILELVEPEISKPSIQIRKDVQKGA